jgi:transcriptional regulator GlxA family with amidase domain
LSNHRIAGTSGRNAEVRWIPAMAHIVGVAVADQMAIFELGVVCEVFGIDRSDIVSPWYDFRLCAVEPQPLRTAAGLLVNTPYGLGDLLDADTILVPAATRASQIDPSPAFLEVLREAHRRGKRIASICGGAYILAAAGLLDGRRATTHWMNPGQFGGEAVQPKACSSPGRRPLGERFRPGSPRCASTRTSSTSTRATY